MMSHLSINSTVLNSSLEIPHSVYRYIRRFTFPLVSIVPSWAMHHIKSDFMRASGGRSALLYSTLHVTTMEVDQATAMNQLEPSKLEFPE